MRWLVIRGLHKGSEIWEAVQGSERMLRHRGQHRRNRSAMKTYRKGKKRISDEIYLQTLSIGTWKKVGSVFQSPSSADSCSLPVPAAWQQRRGMQIFSAFQSSASVFQKHCCLYKVPEFFSNYLELVLRQTAPRPAQAKLCTQCWRVVGTLGKWSW